jgi:hypothetical protein
MRPKDELELVQALRKEVLPDLISAELSNSHYDAVSFQENVIVELKCRRRHYNRLMIERIRYDRLLAIAGQEGMGCLYIVSSPKGVWLFDLVGMPEPKWSKKTLANKTTWATNRVMIEKEVGYLSIYSGTNITHLL